MLLLGFAITILAFGALMPARVAYHECRLRAAARAIERQSLHHYSLAEDMLGFLRGEPLTKADYIERIAKHQDALVQLGRFERRLIPLPVPMLDFDQQDEFVARAIKRISKYSQWSVAFSTGATSIAVTDTAPHLKKWEQLVRELEPPPNVHSAISHSHRAVR